MLSTTQFLIFELDDQCNLSSQHKKCPSNQRCRFTTQKITDTQIIDCVLEAYRAHNFTGYVGFHFYNEPMLQWQRMFDLMVKLKKLVKNIRFVLWTNGTIQPTDKRIKLFDLIYVTDYSNSATQLRQYFGDRADILPVNFDNRLIDPCTIPPNNNPCGRQHIEFIVDCYGIAYLCCQDWRGEVYIGDLHRDSFQIMITRRHQILNEMKRGFLPSRCQRCNEKINVYCFDPIIVEQTRKWLASKD
jgi:sulfatase maturation enzyme AslB (radical SAM superfamily)